MKGGVLIIGSLLWDKDNYNRKEWWKKLDLSRKQKVSLPIRYGRTSEKNRKGTYSMVFSTSLEDSNNLGVGYFVPFIKEIVSEKEFRNEVVDFAIAEGFVGGRIAAGWGSICLKLNPKSEKGEIDVLISNWKKMVVENKENRTSKQTLPNLNDFGEENERKTITDNWILNISDNIFSEIVDIDFILATSNALKHRNTDERKYPSAKEIAKAIVDASYYDYFLKNRLNGIKTKEDRLVLKILRKKYKIKFKEIRRELTISESFT